MNYKKLLVTFQIIETNYFEKCKENFLKCSIKF